MTPTELAAIARHECHEAARELDRIAAAERATLEECHEVAARIGRAHSAAVELLNRARGVDEPRTTL